MAKNHLEGQRRPEANKYLYFLLAIYLFFAVNEAIPSKIVPIRAEVSESPPAELLLSQFPGEVFTFSNSEQMVESFRAVAEAASFENALFCLEYSDRVECLNFSIPQDQTGFVADWQLLEQFLGQTDKSVPPISMFWIHNHPQIIQNTYHIEVTPPPSDSDYFLHQKLGQLAAQYFPDLNFVGRVVGAQGSWLFEMGDNFAMDSFARQRLFQLGVESDADWSDDDPAIVANQIQELQTYLSKLGVLLQFEPDQS